MKYEELGYVFPKISVQAAAKKATAVLEKIANTDSSCLFYVVQASNILALADLRAQSPYNEFRPLFDIKKRKLLADVLHDLGYEIMMEKMPDKKDKRAIFSIMSHSAFNQLPERYTILKSSWKKFNTLDDYEKFYDWSSELQKNLKSKLKNGELPKQWLADKDSPHNIRFGMLLGYPGQAISSFCWDEALHILHGSEPSELTPKIPFQGIYCGTHVNYGYSNELKDNTAIKRHEKLWIEVLQEVYEVFPESRLMQMPGFKTEYAKYKAYDEGG